MRISVFCPAYNEENIICDTVRQLADFFEKNSSEYELIIVNDGSTDGTVRQLEKLQREFPFLKIINHGANQGYGAAIRSGLYACNYEWIFFTDGDRQFNISDISLLLSHTGQYDLIIGYRINRAEGLIRKVNAVCWTKLIQTLFGIRVRDVDCAFKLIRKSVIDTIPQLRANSALISGELLAKAYHHKFRITEVGVRHIDRPAGKATGASLKVITKAFRELIILYPKIKAEL